MDTPVTLPPPVPLREGLGDRTEPPLYRKLVWLTGLRLVVITALLVATAWLSFSSGLSPDPTEASLYAIIGGVYFLSLVSVALLRARRLLGLVAYGQVVLDIVAATGLVYLTGGAESVYTILYPLAIVNASIGLSRRGAATSAALASLSFLALAVAVNHDWVSPSGGFGSRSHIATGAFALRMATNLSAFVLTAALSAYLAEQLRGARTQLAQRETELTALSSLFESIVQSIGSGILTTDGADRITYLNPSGEEILGWRSAELALFPLAERFPDLAKALHGGLEGRGEARLTGPRGRASVVGYAAAPLADNTSRDKPGHVIVFQDLTELRKLEEAVRRSDRLAAVGKLSAGLAHEIRNPLASMTGSVQLLSTALGLTADERKLMQIVLREGERLEALVQDFLTFARPATPEIAEVEIARLAEETLAVFRQDGRAAGLRLDVQVEEGLRVRADAAQLKQVLWNLLTNAAEATDAGGTVSLRVKRAAGGALLSVEDSGNGILEADLPRIFDPFFTTKERGTGLGLAIVHRIIEANRGKIEVLSEPGKGTIFRLHLPAA